jgi:hypothetical protein
LAARFVRDEEAAGSNPATPTQVKGWFRSWNRPFRIRASLMRQGELLRARVEPGPDA